MENEANSEGTSETQKKEEEIPKTWNAAIIRILWQSRWRKVYIVLGASLLLFSFFWNIISSEAFRKSPFATFFYLSDESEEEMDLTGLSSDLEALLDTHPLRQTEKSLQVLQKDDSALTNPLTKHELETFQLVLPRLSPDDIGGHILEVINSRSFFFLTMEEAYLFSVNDFLDEQSFIHVNGGIQNREIKSKKGTLLHTQGLLDQLKDVIAKFLDSNGTKSELALSETWVESLPNNLQSFMNKNNRFTIIQAAFSEQLRLLEIRRNLNEIKRLTEESRVLDKVSVCRFYLRLMGRVYVALSDESLKNHLLDVTIKLSDSGRYDSDSGRSCLKSIIESQPNKALIKQWGNPPTLSYFVVSSMKTPKGVAAVAAIGALGILKFYDRQMIRTTIGEMKRMRRLHSIRRSRIEAELRASLVGKIAQEMEFSKTVSNTDDLSKKILTLTFELWIKEQKAIIEFADAALKIEQQLDSISHQVNVLRQTKQLWEFDRKAKEFAKEIQGKSSEVISKKFASWFERILQFWMQREVSYKAKKEALLQSLRDYESVLDKTRTEFKNVQMKYFLR